MARSRRPASISAVAERAGVSIATVSRVVNGVANKASPETVKRVRAAIAELGYRPSGAGQALRRRESRLVAVIAANLANPSMSAIAASVEMALREAGYVMVLCDSHDRADLQNEYLREMRAQLVSAFVLLGAVNSEVLDEIVAEGETVLFVGRRNPRDTQSDFVGIDNAAAGSEVARLLAARQAGDLLAIHGPLSSSATSERLEAFTATYASLCPEATIDVSGSDEADHLAIGYNITKAHLATGAPPPKALFCLSDLIAYGAYRALLETGHDLPAASTIIGFDDNPLNDWIAPWLSSVRVPYEDFGAAIVGKLKDMWAGETGADVLLEHRLILR